MSEHVEQDSASTSRAGRTARVRQALTLAALRLFAEQGFEATTVDHIAEAAGVGRRTFFRYFRSKEDAIFPAHEERVAEVACVLEAASEDEDAWRVVSRCAERVLDMYLTEPQISLRRYALTRAVGSLRDREIASVDQYQRVFARYLRGRFAALPDGELWAAVIASGLVATHNHVLRQWLKSGGEVDARQLFRQAMGRLTEMFTTSESSGEHTDNVVVGVVRTASSADAVLRRVRGALREFDE